MISEHAREAVTQAVVEDFRGATVLSVSPSVDTDGRIVFDRIMIRLLDGRELRIVPDRNVPDMHCGDPVIVAIKDSRFGPIELDAFEDYSDADPELKWYPDLPEPWDRD